MEFNMETLPGFDWSEKERIDECMMLMMSVNGKIM